MDKPALNQFQEFAKRLVRLAVHKLGGNHAAGDWTGFDTSELSRWASDDISDKHIHLWRWIAMDEGADHAGLKALARRYGFELVTKDQKAELALNVNKVLGRLAHCGADMQSTVLDAAADGKATPNEIKNTEAVAGALISAAEDSVRAVTRLRAI